jgi:hypothetical protein
MPTANAREPPWNITIILLLRCRLIFLNMRKAMLPGITLTILETWWNESKAGPECQRPKKGK